MIKLEGMKVSKTRYRWIINITHVIKIEAVSFNKSLFLLEPTCLGIFLSGQCLQSRFGSVVVSQLVRVDQQNIKHV